jgi:hypothetical protein
VSKLTENDQGYDRHVFLCECGCCYLRLTWDDDDPDFRFLWCENWSTPRGFRKRIRPTWHSEVVLTEETAAAIAAVLVPKGFE